MDKIYWNLTRVARLQMWLIVFCLLHVTLTASADLGDIYPREVNLRVGEPLNLTCNINWAMARDLNPSFNESDLDLLFFRMDGKIVDQSSIRVRNSSAIDLYIPEMNTPGGYRFVCGLDKIKKIERTKIAIEKRKSMCPPDEICYIGVNLVRVNVGYAPKPVKNFRCISYNWLKMNCTFDKEVNSIYTYYNLTYRPKVIVSRIYSKELLNTNNNSTSYTFEVDDYYNSHDLYSFTLDISNILGSVQQTFEVDTFKCVKPDPPLNMNVTRRNPTNVTLTWYLHYNLNPFEPGFIHEGIIIRSPNEMGITEKYKLNMKELREEKFGMYSLTINNLYAHMWYEVQIRLHVPNATREEVWSNYTKFQFQTLAKIPDRPPEVNIGSFCVNDHNDIWLYWKQLPLEEQNGNNSHYVISNIKSTDGTELPIPAHNLTTIMAKLISMPDKDYIFTIRSANSEGESINSSTIYVPKQSKRFPKPEKLKKYSIDYKYKLTWSPPNSRRDELVSYTVFWCESKTNYPSECNGPVSFETVDTSVREFELANTKAINLALSANSLYSSSGMIWAMCTASKSDEIGKINSVYVSKMDATYMEIQWNVDCIDTPIVAGYTLTYCPITAPKNLSCKPGTEITTNFTGTTQYNITGLTPYTTYKTTIAMYSKTRMGRASEPLVNTTLEAAPTPPRNLNIRDQTNTSLVISWDAPERANGFLKKYIVWCNSTEYSVFLGIQENKTIVYTIENLRSYSVYEIGVVACTIGCSNMSESVTVQTKMGVPGRIKLSPNAMNPRYDDYVVLSWERPEYAGGNLDYYEIFTTISLTGNKTEEYLTKLNATNCWMHRPCQKSWKGIELSIRAVNVVRSAHLIAGVGNITNASMIIDFGLQNTDYSAIPQEIHDLPACWGTRDERLENWLLEDKHPTYLKSKDTGIFTHSCSLGQSSPLLYIFIIFVGVVGTAALVVFGYRKCKTMSDIKVVLPDALNDINKDTKCPKMGEMIDGGVLRTVPIHHREPRVQQDEQERSLLRNHMESSSSSTTSSTANVDNQSQCESHDGPPEELDSMEEHHDEEDDKSSIESQQEPPDSVSFDVLKPEEVDEVKIHPVDPQTHKVALCAGVNQYVHFARPSQGYTQLASLKAPIKTPMMVTETDETGISGYVTRKQLADFGQRM
ncbi:cytokine receptor [Phlebotomus argentipes]|uniref:cytokine receptor n=1 Tax=Phlebotomus argentipes TaxID=94469 RepID=UPI002893131E|nr:cytokine receptor [Phlebotomus argentipes]